MTSGKEDLAVKVLLSLCKLGLLPSSAACISCDMVQIALQGFNFSSSE